jgi:hypothetical protein
MGWLYDVIWIEESETDWVVMDALDSDDGIVTGIVQASGQTYEQKFYNPEKPLPQSSLWLDCSATFEDRDHGSIDVVVERGKKPHLQTHRSCTGIRSSEAKLMVERGEINFVFTDEDLSTFKAVFGGMANDSVWQAGKVMTDINARAEIWISKFVEESEVCEPQLRRALAQALLRDTLLEEAIGGRILASNNDRIAIVTLLHNTGFNCDATHEKMACENGLYDLSDCIRSLMRATSDAQITDLEQAEKVENITRPCEDATMFRLWDTDLLTFNEFVNRWVLQRGLLSIYCPLAVDVDLSFPTDNLLFFVARAGVTG